MNRRDRCAACLIALLGLSIAAPAFAQDAREAEQADETSEDDEKKAKAEKVDAKKDSKPKTKLRNRRLSSGLGFTLGVGGLATLRRMTFAGTDAEIVHRPGIYFGGTVSASQHVLTFKSSKSHLLIEAEGGFGSAKDSEVEPALGRPLTTEHVYLLALGMFEKPIHPAVDLRLGLGMSGESFTVEQNPEYTGHRYLALAASVGAAYWTSDKLRVGGRVVFLPGVDTNQSARGYGSARSFGGRGEAYLVWRFIQPEPPDLFGAAELMARYTLTRYQTTMPETQALGDLGRTTDTGHAIVLGLSYNL